MCCDLKFYVIHIFFTLNLKSNHFRSDIKIAFWDSELQQQSYYSLMRKTLSIRRIQPRHKPQLNIRVDSWVSWVSSLYRTSRSMRQKLKTFAVFLLFLH